MFTLPRVEPIPDWTKLGVADADKIAELRAKELERSRAAWGERLSLARSTIPERYRWIRPNVRAQWDMWTSRLPWITAEHIARFRAAWVAKTNILICGDVGLGKTCLAVLHAAWTLAEAGYDAPAIAKARADYAAWEAEPRQRRLVGKGSDGSELYALSCAPSPILPEHLPQMKAAQGLRFVEVSDLLEDNLQGASGQRLSEALRSSVLYLDDVGREMANAKGDGHLASGRRAVMMRILGSRWSNDRGFVATTEYTTDALGDMYGNGSFRRIAGEQSGAIVIDLGDDEWAGRWLKQLKSARK